MKAMGIIFSNIYDSTLSELTRVRTVASLPYGARYRQIDFILSNMSNSGIKKIGIVTKYNYQSLMDHLGSCHEWDLNVKNHNVKILPPYATGHNGVYRGKLDALDNQMDFLLRSDEEYIVLSDSTTICAIDLEEVVAAHEKSGADVTVVLSQIDQEHEQTFQLTADLAEDGSIEALQVGIPASKAIAGTGIYVLKRTDLMDIVKKCVSRGDYHFERDFLLQWFKQGKIKVNAYLFKDPALFNTSTVDYYRNSMKLLDKDIFDGIFMKRGQSIYTKVRDSAPSYYGEESEAINSLIGDGCKIKGKIDSSILFREVTVAQSASIKDCIIMQGCEIGEGAVIEGIILDKNVKVRPYTVLKGSASHPIVIEKGAVI